MRFGMRRVVVGACAAAVVAALAMGPASAGTARPGAAPAAAPSAGSASSAAAAAAADQVFKAALVDVESWWATKYKQVGIKKFFPLPTAPVPYDESTGQPGCGTSERTAYDRNAFYCSQDDFVAFDSQNLIPELDKAYGDLGVAVIAAHEYGHRIQQFLGLLDKGLPTIVTEQQADCYAGAWTAERGKKFMRGSQLGDGMASLVSVRDRAGGSTSSAGAHGSGFDRASVFQTGYEGGVTKCATFARHPPATVTIPFVGQNEAQSGGNLPTRQVIDLATQDLDNFWRTKVKGLPRISITEPYELSGLLPTCPGTHRSKKQYRNVAYYCASRNSVAWDQDYLNGLATNIGDLAPVVELADAWASAVQHHTGHATTGAAATDQADCLTGAWLGAIVRSKYNSLLTLSPGDLDEAIQALLASRGNSFDRVLALQKGFSGDVKVCGI